MSEVPLDIRLETRGADAAPTARPTEMLNWIDA
jgi:hypothetical protein